MNLAFEPAQRPARGERCARALVDALDHELVLGVHTVEAVTLRDAVEAAASLAEPGDVVVLSPACASFDWYRNYGERGDDFVRCVQDLVLSGGGS